jgi:hypothetical protein
MRSDANSSAATKQTVSESGTRDVAPYFAGSAWRMPTERRRQQPRVIGPFIPHPRIGSADLDAVSGTERHVLGTPAAWLSQIWIQHWVAN